MTEPALSDVAATVPPLETAIATVKLATSFSPELCAQAVDGWARAMGIAASVDVLDYGAAARLAPSPLKCFFPSLFAAKAYHSQSYASRTEGSTVSDAQDRIDPLLAAATVRDADALATSPVVLAAVVRACDLVVGSDGASLHLVHPESRDHFTDSRTGGARRKRGVGRARASSGEAPSPDRDMSAEDDRAFQLAASEHGQGVGGLLGTALANFATGSATLDSAIGLIPLVPLVLVLPPPPAAFPTCSAAGSDPEAANPATSLAAHGAMVEAIHRTLSAAGLGLVPSTIAAGWEAGGRGRRVRASWDREQTGPLGSEVVAVPEAGGVAVRNRVLVVTEEELERWWGLRISPKSGGGDAVAADGWYAPARDVAAHSPFSESACAALVGPIIRLTHAVALACAACVHTAPLESGRSLLNACGWMQTADGWVRSAAAGLPRGGRWREAPVESALRRAEGKKALSVDCDWTLWGGVASEAAAATAGDARADAQESRGAGSRSWRGIALGGGFASVRRAVMWMRDQRGWVVGLCSRNTEDDVRAAMQALSDLDGESMVPKEESFACLWNGATTARASGLSAVHSSAATCLTSSGCGNAAVSRAGDGVSFVAAGHGAKSALLTRAAASLGVARGALVHLDDNPVEVAEIASSAPDILSLRVPARLDAWSGAGGEPEPGLVGVVSEPDPVRAAEDVGRDYRAAVAALWALDEPLWCPVMRLVPASADDRHAAAPRASSAAGSACTAEDTGRAGLYAAERQRVEAARTVTAALDRAAGASSSSSGGKGGDAAMVHRPRSDAASQRSRALASFLVSLRLAIEPVAADAATLLSDHGALNRIMQLTVRTNQVNACKDTLSVQELAEGLGAAARRHRALGRLQAGDVAEELVRAARAGPDVGGLTITASRVTDRFGCYGLVTVAACTDIAVRLRRPPGRAASEGSAHGGWRLADGCPLAIPAGLAARMVGGADPSELAGCEPVPVRGVAAVARLLLCSCRVLQRGAEQACVSHLGALARQAVAALEGATTLGGGSKSGDESQWLAIPWVPSDRNEPARALLFGPKRVGETAASTQSSSSSSPSSPAAAALDDLSAVKAPETVPPMAGSLFTPLWPLTPPCPAGFRGVCDESAVSEAAAPDAWPIQGMRVPRCLRLVRQATASALLVMTRRAATEVWGRLEWSRRQSNRANACAAACCDSWETAISQGFAPRASRPPCPTALSGGKCSTFNRGKPGHCSGFDHTALLCPVLLQAVVQRARSAAAGGGPAAREHRTASARVTRPTTLPPGWAATIFACAERAGGAGGYLQLPDAAYRRRQAATTLPPPPSGLPESDTEPWPFRTGLDRAAASEAEQAVVERLSRDPASLTASLSGAAFAEAQAAAAAAAATRAAEASSDDADASVVFSAKNGGLASFLGGTKAGSSTAAMEAMKTSTGLEPQPWMTDDEARRAALRSVKPPPGVLFVPLAAAEQCRFDAHAAARRAVREAELAAAPAIGHCSDSQPRPSAAPSQVVDDAAAAASAATVAERAGTIADDDECDDGGPPGYAGPSGCFLASETYSDLASVLSGFADACVATARQDAAMRFLGRVGRGGMAETAASSSSADSSTGLLAASSTAGPGMLATLDSLRGAGESRDSSSAVSEAEAAKAARIWTELDGAAIGPHAAKQALLARSELRRRAREAAKRLGV